MYAIRARAREALKARPFIDHGFVAVWHDELHWLMGPKGHNAGVFPAKQQESTRSVSRHLLPSRGMQ